jgi:MFS family permease
MLRVLDHPRSVFFGWKVVAAACVTASCAFGFGYFGPAVFLNVLHAQRGWQVSLISIAITEHFLVSALLIPYLPVAHVRFGIAAVTLAGVISLLMGILGWSLAADPWQLFIAAVLSGAGWAATGSAAIIAMVSPWFERRRALALGHALNGASIGGIVFAPLWVTVISGLGFAEAVFVVGIVTLAVLGPLTWRYLRPTPACLGLAPDGDATPPVPQQNAPRQAASAKLSCLIRSGAFASVSVAFALGMFAQVGITSHIVERLAPLAGAQLAAAAISLQTTCAMLGRIVHGLWLARADTRLVAAGNLVMQACGLALLATGSTLIVLVPGCVLFGLGIGSLLLLPPLIAQRDFAPSDVPRVVALVTAINQTVMAFAPAVLGLLREASGSYALPFLLAVIIQVFAAAIVILGRPRTA